MTHEQVTRHWDAIVAFHDGKPIEMREPGCANWYPTPTPEFLPDWDYRERRQAGELRRTTDLTTEERRLILDLLGLYDAANFYTYEMQSRCLLCVETEKCAKHEHATFESLRKRCEEVAV